ncbi:MAG TPA: hypothetical protein DCX89_04960 [Saprospirales bacterium]|nr:hypothetical protein [Saprospirales bacterium]HRQ28974.1 MarR family winged helix-turn-helix transcriptional regulator [Saprospiraceae bacterium]
MSDNIELIRQLLGFVQDFENEGGKADIKEFALFLRDKTILENPANLEYDFNLENYQNYKSYPEVEFSTLLTGLFRFAKFYIKKALSGTSIKTLDEFGFLATLLRNGSLLKNELINSHLLEISSGSEVLKRLINSGLVSESPDENDKRAKRVCITPLGITELMESFKVMHKVSEIVIGNLDKSELLNALTIFNKLHYFHQNIQDCDKNASLDDLHEKYVVYSYRPSAN